VNPQLATIERPWIHACVVFPEEADLSGIEGVPVNPQLILPYPKVLVFHPSQLCLYVTGMGQSLDRETASMLVTVLGRKIEGTWIEGVAPQIETKRRRRWRLTVVWD
jgi:hypothetical protein